MPIFEYTCKDCRHHFEVIVSGKQKPACPACESRRLEKMLSVFAVNAKSGAAMSATRFNDGPSPCGSCGDPRGPGSCSMN
jgi:putative FmdB family regulatory protein